MPSAATHPHPHYNPPPPRPGDPDYAPPARPRRRVIEWRIVGALAMFSSALVTLLALEWFVRLVLQVLT